MCSRNARRTGPNWGLSTGKSESVSMSPRAGNAFPALGLMLTLSDLPVDNPQFGPVLRAFREHMSALGRFQDEDGLWREVIDHPGAYPEYTATAMIAASMLRGINNGWLGWDEFQPPVD